MAKQKPRYGYRRLGVLPACRGIALNHKKLYRLYRAGHLAVRRLKRKRLAREAAPIIELQRANQNGRWTSSWTDWSPDGPCGLSR